jgi:2,4-dienoyl-CoA reductase-like NADH-dependent reductase (Old Yellow Enzyme family)
MNTKYSPLFESFTLKSGVSLKNRIVMAPMTHWSSHEDGTVSDAEIKYYARRSKGVGMVITACVYVTPNGKGFSGEFAADSDEMIPSLRRLAATIQDQGAKAILQIYHGGRSCPPEEVPNGEIVSASAIAEDREGAKVPRALTDAEIEGIIRDYAEATRRAIEAGYDGVEIHGANGYLLQQFFSPSSNHREDRWGGSLEKRLAFPIAVAEAVKEAASHAKHPFVVGYRFSPEEPGDDGITMEDSYRLVEALIDRGMDYLHVSLQDFWSLPRRGADESRTRMEWFHTRYGSQITLIGVGGLHTADDVLKAHESGIPLIALGRELIVDPDWVEKVEQGRAEEIQTTLTPRDQERLVVPDHLWERIMAMKGWFPVVESK